MHFGDTAPLRQALSNVKAKIPELLTMTFDEGPGGSAWGPNTAVGVYVVDGGGQVRITARAYDAAVSAKAALARDMNMISVGPSATAVVDGVTVYEYGPYGAMRFQIGPHTFDVHAFPKTVPWTILQKVLSVLAAGKMPIPRP